MKAVCIFFVSCVRYVILSFFATLSLLVQDLCVKVSVLACQVSTLDFTGIFRKFLFNISLKMEEERKR
jgi:hypothetical protein